MSMMKTADSTERIGDNGNATRRVARATIPHMLTPKHSPRGFTLLERIVSIGLFTVVMTIAMSAYLSLISLNRKARATNDVVSNLSYVVESMGRSIRTGTNYDCGGLGGAQNCWDSTGSTQFNFTNSNGQTMTYLLQSGGVIGMCPDATSCGNPQPLTDPRINVTDLHFFVQGVGTTGGDLSLQPRVVFTISGSITPEVGAAPVSFSIQSSATERLIDIP